MNFKSNKKKNKYLIIFTTEEKIDIVNFAFSKILNKCFLILQLLKLSLKTNISFLRMKNIMKLTLIDFQILSGLKIILVLPKILIEKHHFNLKEKEFSTL